MYLRDYHRGDWYYFYLVEKVKVEEDKYKEIFLKKIGALPEDCYSPVQIGEVKGLISTSIKDTQKACKEKYSKREVTEEEVIEYVKEHKEEILKFIESQMETDRT